MSQPFDYPARPHLRRHSPPEFKAYKRYKDYLRDEFKFRCVYCLVREKWLGSDHFFSVEHYHPKSKSPSRIVDYSNLLYACMDCNRAKGASIFPADVHPEENPYGRHLKIESSGVVQGLSPEGVFIIQQLNLNEPLRVDYRRMHHDLFEMALRLSNHPDSRRLLMDFFGFPSDMPTFAPNSGAKSPYAMRVGLPDWY